MTTSDAYPDAEIPLPRLRTICHLWTCAAVLAGLGVAALALDVPVAAWVKGGNCPDAIAKLCSLSEVFGHGLGVAAVVAIIAVVDPWHRYAIPRILAASLGSGILADLFKLLLARARPYHFDLQGRGLDTFSNWFPLLRNGSWDQSFPSAHMATAVGLAVVLACFYPRGRWLFPGLAVLVGLQRMLEESHFLSDVFWGAAVGCVFAPLCVYGSRLSRGFDRLEAFLLARSAAMARVRALNRPAPKSASAVLGPADVSRAA